VFWLRLGLSLVLAPRHERERKLEKDGGRAFRIGLSHSELALLSFYTNPINPSKPFVFPLDVEGECALQISQERIEKEREIVQSIEAQSELTSFSSSFPISDFLPPDPPPSLENELHSKVYPSHRTLPSPLTNFCSSASATSHGQFIVLSLFHPPPRPLFLPPPPPSPSFIPSFL